MGRSGYQSSWYPGSHPEITLRSRSHPEPMVPEITPHHTPAASYFLLLPDHYLSIIIIIIIITCQDTPGAHPAHFSALQPRSLCPLVPGMAQPHLNTAVTQHSDVNCWFNRLSLSHVCAHKTFKHLSLFWCCRTPGVPQGAPADSPELPSAHPPWPLSDHSDQNHSAASRGHQLCSGGAFGRAEPCPGSPVQLLELLRAQGWAGLGICAPCSAPLSNQASCPAEMSLAFGISQLSNAHHAALICLFHSKVGIIRVHPTVHIPCYF